MRKLYVAVLINLALLVLLINVNLQDYQVFEDISSIPGVGTYIFNGDYKDFEKQWQNMIPNSKVHESRNFYCNSDDSEHILPSYSESALLEALQNAKEMLLQEGEDSPNGPKPNLRGGHI